MPRQRRSSVPRPFPTVRSMGYSTRPPITPQARRWMSCRCSSPWRGARVPAKRGVLVPDRHRGSGRDGALLERYHRQRRAGKRVWLVQEPLGSLVADQPAHADRGTGGGRRGGAAGVTGLCGGYEASTPGPSAYQAPAFSAGGRTAHPSGKVQSAGSCEVRYAQQDGSGTRVRPCGRNLAFGGRP